MSILRNANFPKLVDPVSATLAPLVLQPMLGSPEQYVVAIAAVGANGFHVEQANKLVRLECLFGSKAVRDLRLVIRAATDALEIDLANRGRHAIQDYKRLFSGVTLGDLREVEGRSLEEIGRRWMAQSSSLYEVASSLPQTQADFALVVAVEAQRERLPIQIMDYVATKRPDLINNFDQYIRRGAVRRRQAVHGVIIDYAGSRLAANFDALVPQQYTVSVNRIKRRLWDLKIARDTRDAKRKTQSHEIFVQHPPQDMLRTRRMGERIAEALAGLEEQADKEEIRFRAMTSANEIGSKILELEQPAA